MDCPNVDANLPSCNCTYSGCSRKGKCCECLRYHLDMKQLPACAFSAAAESTYDRSYEKFIEDQR